jgi:hypothetical protein
MVKSRKAEPDVARRFGNPGGSEILVLLDFLAAPEVDFVWFGIHNCNRLLFGWPRR